MVVPALDVAVVLEAPLPDHRSLPAGRVAFSLRLTRFDLGVEVTAGLITPTDAEYTNHDALAGWSLAQGPHVALRIPIRNVELRGVVTGSLVVHDHATWFEERYTRVGGAASGGCDLLVPVSAFGWGAVGVRAEVSTLDGPRILVGIGVGVAARK